MSLKDILDVVMGLKTIVGVVIDSKLLAATTNYAAEDAMSESATAGTAYHFRDMARRKDGSGVIEKAQVFCSTTALTPRVTLYLFSKLPTTNLYDNVANAAPSASDHPSFEGQIDFPALEDLGGGSASIVTPSTVGNLPLPYKCEDGNLYGIAVTRDAITGEAAGMTLQFKLQIRQD